MSHAHDHQAAGYGEGGRTARPLFALIPIGILIFFAVAMLVGGIHIMTTPSSPFAGEAHVAQTTAPAGAS